MKTIPAVIISVLLFPLGINAMSSTVPTAQQQLISAEKASEAAISGYREQSWAFPAEYGRAMKGAKPGPPLLVERLDREAFYYIVPFVRDGKTTLLIMVAADTGAFQETVPLSEPGVYLPLSAEAAKEKLIEHREADGSAVAILEVPPALVWKPSAPSRSPFEPFWRFQTDHGERYVDQTGAVHSVIEQPRFKGG